MVRPITTRAKFFGENRMLRHLATRTSVLALLATPSLAQQVPAPQTSADLAQPSAEVAMHPEYAATVARSAYVWGWPMVNMLNP